jgi:hypothetical protein
MVDVSRFPRLWRRLEVGDHVAIPVRIANGGRYRLEGTYVSVCPGRLGFHSRIWVRLDDLIGEIWLRVTVRGFRLAGALVQVEAAIPQLRQLVWVPRWAIRRPWSGCGNARRTASDSDC